MVQGLVEAVVVVLHETVEQEGHLNEMVEQEGPLNEMVEQEDHLNESEGVEGQPGKEAVAVRLVWVVGAALMNLILMVEEGLNLGWPVKVRIHDWLVEVGDDSEQMESKMEEGVLDDLLKRME